MDSCEWERINGAEVSAEKLSKAEDAEKLPRRARRKVWACDAKQIETVPHVRAFWALTWAFRYSRRLLNTQVTAHKAGGNLGHRRGKPW
jgi:hypothetical protein